MKADSNKSKKQNKARLAPKIRGHFSETFLRSLPQHPVSGSCDCAARAALAVMKFKLNLGTLEGLVPECYASAIIFASCFRKANNHIFKK